MSNLTTKMTQTSIEINGKLYFSQIWDGQTSLNLTHCLKYVNDYFSDEIFEKITLFLFIIYSFSELKVLVSPPKSCHGPPDSENALQLAWWPCHWSHFNSVKQADNTVGVQWGLTLNILPVNTVALTSRSQRTTLEWPPLYLSQPVSFPIFLYWKKIAMYFSESFSASTKQSKSAWKLSWGLYLSSISDNERFFRTLTFLFARVTGHQLPTDLHT